MAKLIKLTRTGWPEVLELSTADRADPGPNEAWIEQEAIGVNYLDVMQRSGAVPIPLPNGLGLEGARHVRKPSPWQMQRVRTLRSRTGLPRVPLS